MFFISLPRMFLSETEGWEGVVNIRLSVIELTVFYVAPMSLIPPLMYAYAQLVFPGDVTPLVAPPLTIGELALVGAAFFIIELVMVALMGAYIQQLADSLDIRVGYADAYTLAAIAPTPLWLSALALFVPNTWFNVLVIAAAWIGSVALIHHGIHPLFKMDDKDKARQLAHAVTAAGVGVWIGLLAVLVLSLGILLGWR